jgi:hypothetical protein
MTESQSCLENARVFGCSAFVPRFPRQSKLDVRAVEGVLLQSLDHGIYKVLIAPQQPCCFV